MAIPMAASARPAMTMRSRPRPRVPARSEAAPAHGTSRRRSTLSIAITPPIAVRWSPSTSRTSERDERAQERPGDAREESSQPNDRAPDQRRPRQHRPRLSSECSGRRGLIAARCYAAVRGADAVEALAGCHLEPRILDSARNAGQ